MGWPALLRTTRREARRWLRFARGIVPRIFRRPSLGERGERCAAAYLRKLGYRIVARGYRVTRGEIDIVAVTGRTIVFVEVKTREDDSGGSAVEAVNIEKQRRITRAALRFLRRHDILGNPTRFDIVGVTWPSGSRQPKIEHLQAAFESPLPDSFYA
jgi:putative endonuclease